jgi:hypothetical protein
MYESIYLKPDTKHLKELSANMKAHNKKYHNTAPYTALVWNVSTGPRAGDIVWMMGPCTFTDLDSRPSADGHDDDWMHNVLPYVKDVGTGEYWRRDDDLSMPSDDGKPIIRVRFMVVNQEEDHRVDGLLEQISKTVKEMEGDFSWSVYDNMFRQGSIGRHIALVTGFNNWAALDEDGNFGEVFNKIYGEDAVRKFGEEMADVFEDSYDEYWTLMPELSGMDNE